MSGNGAADLMRLRSSRSRQRRSHRIIGTSRSAVALDLRVNLAPVDVEHADGDGVGRPINVCDKRNRADSVPGVGGEFANDIRRIVQKLDSLLHSLYPRGDVPKTRSSRSHHGAAMTGVASPFVVWGHWGIV